MSACIRCQQNPAGLPETPYPGDLGKMIVEKICPGCWEGWKKFSVNVINDYKLRPFLPQDRAVVEKHMKQYLNLDPQGLPAFGVPNAPKTITLTGQGVVAQFPNEPVKSAAKKPGEITREDVVDALEQIFDPEIPVNIYDLGLIYDIRINGKKIAIDMTLTSRHCPAAQSLPATVKQSVSRMKGVEDVDVRIVWEPTWTKDKISEEGRRILGN